MKTTFLLTSTALSLILVCAIGSAQGASEAGGIRRLDLVPTFQSIGAYVTLAGPLDGLSAELSYRPTGAPEWQRALAPVACPADDEFRGSILLLAPATRYEVKAQVRRGDTVVAEQTAVTTTWADTVPIAREVMLPPGTAAKPLVISDRGTPDGWIRYRAAPGGSTIDAGTAAPNAVLVKNAAYVIVEGLTIRGGASDAVQVLDSHDVRIADCDIAGWGDPGKWGFYSDAKRKQWSYLDASGKIIDRQAGIRVHGAGSERVVLEQNLIHDPRGTASCWAFEHPHGPSGIVLSETGGHNVVRYNDLIAGDGHRWNDAIESEFNGEVNGGPYRDTDLYGNLLVSPNDDGTELDGGQMNVRYWDNWIEGGLCGVSTAPNLKGPSYVFRNLIVSGDERGACGAGFKLGGDPGVTFLLNNTVYVGNYGLTSGHYGKNPSVVFSRDNVFAGPAGGLGRVRVDQSVAGDLEHDLIPSDGLVGTDVSQPGRESTAAFAMPRFAAPDERDFRLVAGASASGASGAEALPNLGSGLMGAIPGAAGRFSWPLRPGAPELAPGRKVVRVQAGATASFSLAVSADGSWRAEAGEPWLRLTPDAAGRTLAGEIDAHELAVGTHRTFASVRDSRGRLRSVPLEVEVEPAAAVTFRFEPEKSLPLAGFKDATAPGASGGEFVQVVSTEGAGRMAFPFDVKKADKFFVLARVRAAGPVAKIGTQDSVALQIDDGAAMTWDFFSAGTGTWQWVRATPKENVAGAFALAAGRHLIQIGPREIGAQVDEVIVSTSPFPPAAL